MVYSSYGHQIKNSGTNSVTVCPTSGSATQRSELGRVFRTWLQPTVLEPQQVTLAALLPASLRRKVLYQEQISLIALKSISQGARKDYSLAVIF